MMMMMTMMMMMMMMIMMMMMMMMMMIMMTKLMMIVKMMMMIMMMIMMMMIMMMIKLLTYAYRSVGNISCCINLKLPHPQLVASVKQASRNVVGSQMDYFRYIEHLKLCKKICLRLVFGFIFDILTLFDLYCNIFLIHGLVSFLFMIGQRIGFL